MAVLLAAAGGALLLCALEALWLLRFFPHVSPQEVWLLHSAPSGFLLGLGSALALSARPGLGKALRCLAAALLGLVPLGIWLWVGISVDPIHALPYLLRMLLLCVPTLVWSLLLTLVGLVNLRPARFRKRPTDEEI